MIIKSLTEIQYIKESSIICSAALANIATLLRPGLTTLQLDAIIHAFIVDNGGTPSFLNYGGFPFASCIAVNDAIVHGAPNARILVEGDIVSIDVGVLKNGFHGDQAYTFCIGEGTSAHMHLINTTKMALLKGILTAKVGNRIGDIGYAISNYISDNELMVIKDFAGHAIGTSLHEDPLVPNFGAKGKGKLLKENTTFAIEPIVSTTNDFFIDSDNWTYRTGNAAVAAHFEHTIVVEKNGPRLLTDFTGIEYAEQNNKYLTPSIS